jgi:phage baseplate assembly protein W
MAIKIKSLEQVAKNYVEQTYVYKDIQLDLQLTKIVSPGFKQAIASSDIKASFDLGAIKNSLLNLFNTLPGQRFLFPEYGLNLQQFLFEPITVENGDMIGNLIFNSIRAYEPRVIPRQVRVLGDPDRNQYNITINIEVPIFNLATDTTFLLDLKSQSFITLEPSQ